MSGEESGPKVKLPAFLLPAEEQPKEEPELKEAPPLSESEEAELFGESRKGKVWEGHEKGTEPEEGRPWGGSLTKGEETSWGDHMIKDSEELSFRHETLAHMAASGMTQKKMAFELGLTPGRVSVLLSNSLVKTRVREIQATYWGGNIEKRFKQAIPKAMDVIEKSIVNEYDDYSKAEQLKSATWLLEKTTGKAKQEIDYTSTSIGDLFNRVDDMLRKGEVIDVSPEKRIAPTAAEQETVKKDDEFDNWIETNLGGEDGKAE